MIASDSTRFAVRPEDAGVQQPIVHSSFQMILGIDTCGPSGSVALGRLAGGKVDILSQTELAGRSYSATLISAVGELLAAAGITVRDLAALVVVNGPGSFTGVRVGLSATKGLAEAAQLPVVAVSRLEVLAAKAQTGFSALDAHRHEIFFRVSACGSTPRELLAGESDLAVLSAELQSGQLLMPPRIALCDEAASVLLNKFWPEVEQVYSSAPTAADALHLCAERVVACEFVDIALVDGYYLRRSDAEIFGNQAVAPQP
jgi:tRNA threonylcarbamoyladenosine biosynthesis protein TsaB